MSEDTGPVDEGRRWKRLNANTWAADMEPARTIHVKFTSDETVWRYIDWGGRQPNPNPPPSPFVLLDRGNPEEEC